MTESAAPAERAILDTSVLIGDQVASISGSLAISTITLAELNFGVLVAKSAEVRAERLRASEPAAASLRRATRG